MRPSPVVSPFLVLALGLLAACGPAAAPPRPTALPTPSFAAVTPPPATPLGTGTQVLRLATTRALAASGLLQALLPGFTQANNARVDLLPADGAQAVALGAAGQADAVLVDDHAAEAQFLAAGAGLNELDVMSSDFVLVGPTNDPAATGGLGSAADALSLIALSGAPFVAPGGADSPEPALWAVAGVTQTAGASWYLPGGPDLAGSLAAANAKPAYTISDRATWLAQKGQLPNLRLLVGGASQADDKDPALKRTFGIIPANPAQFPKANFKLATAFADWITSAPVQQEIGAFERDTLGQAIFAPAAAGANATQP